MTSNRPSYTLEVVPYKPTWKNEFLEVATPIKTALKQIALFIHHIGSTSIPNMIAKDRIDMQVTVFELNPEVENRLNRVGYHRIVELTHDHIPPGYDENLANWTKWVFIPSTDVKPVNLHVRIVNYLNQRYPILFRDYLRCYPESVKNFGKMKENLILNNNKDRDFYYSIKDPVCDIIMIAAEEWAEKTSWVVPPSDI